MSKYLKLFETHTQYETSKSGLILPNVSYCLDTANEVHYNPTVSATGVTLNKSKLSLSKGETETLIATVTPSNASNKNVTWSSSDDSVATVNSNGVVTAVGDNGNANITVTTVDGGYTAQCAFNIIDPYNGHDYVEIGGLKWATMNIGANSVTDYGLKFQWGDTQGYTDAQVGSGDGKKYFGWADYKYGNGASSPSDTGITKYNASDGKTVLESSDDAARANWGGSWRMPTEEDFADLTWIYATSAWTTNYEGSGVAGMVFTSKADNSVKLFFPAAGYCVDGRVYQANGAGYYWTNYLNTSSMPYAITLYLDSSWAHAPYLNIRSNGCLVRPVIG